MKKKIYHLLIAICIILGLQILGIVSVRAANTQTIEGTTAILKVPDAGEWKHDRKGWWYAYDKGGYPKNGWKKLLNQWSYFDGRGYAATNWKKINGEWYYFAPKKEYTQAPVIMQKGQITIGSKEYYLYSSGEMHTGWKKINGSWYYYKLRDGYKLKNTWSKIGGEWYYFAADGKMASREWIGRYWCTASGAWDPNYGPYAAEDLSDHLNENFSSAMKKFVNAKADKSWEPAVVFTHAYSNSIVNFGGDENTIEYISFSKDGNYNIKGIRYGMSLTVAKNLAFQAGYKNVEKEGDDGIALSNDDLEMIMLITNSKGIVVEAGIAVPGAILFQ